MAPPRLADHRKRDAGDMDERRLGHGVAQRGGIVGETPGGGGLAPIAEAALGPRQADDVKADGAFGIAPHMRRVETAGGYELDELLGERVATDLGGVGDARLAQKAGE